VAAFAIWTELFRPAYLIATTTVSTSFELGPVVVVVVVDELQVADAGRAPPPNGAFVPEGDVGE